MFEDGSVVTLATTKSHGEGEAALKLAAGICGMVVRRERKTDNNHLYIVDFGPYGQWHCYHNELVGDDSEGWDDSADNPIPRVEDLLRITPRPPRPQQQAYIMFDDEEGPKPSINAEADIERKVKEMERKNAF